MTRTLFRASLAMILLGIAISVAFSLAFEDPTPHPVLTGWEWPVYPNPFPSQELIDYRYRYDIERVCFDYCLRASLPLMAGAILLKAIDLSRRLCRAIAARWRRLLGGVHR